MRKMYLISTITLPSSPEIKTSGSVPIPDDIEVIEIEVSEFAYPEGRFYVHKPDDVLLEMIHDQPPGKLERLEDIDFGDIEMRVLANVDIIREQMRVERVARALCKDMLLSETGWRMFENTARAAIEAY